MPYDAKDSMFKGEHDIWTIPVPDELANPLRIEYDEADYITMPESILRCMRERFRTYIDLGRTISFDIAKHTSNPVPGAKRVDIDLADTFNVPPPWAYTRDETGLVIFVHIEPENLKTEANILKVGNFVLNELTLCTPVGKNMSEQLSAENVETAKGLPPGVISSFINPRLSGPRIEKRRKTRELKDASGSKGGRKHKTRRTKKHSTRTRKQHSKVLR